MKIVVVDDDKLVSASLKTIIETDSEIQVAGIGYSGADAIELFETHAPDILLMDIRMDGMTGLEAGEAILRRHCHAKILFLTTFADDEYIVRALKIGAKGYMLKQNFESIVPSLKAVSIGQSVFGDEIVAKIPSLISGEKTDLKKYDISEKEEEIIRLISEGLSNKEIANALYLGEGTVRNSISVILDKLHLRGRTQIAIFYFKNK
ncbi:MAG TPA: response regulator transcription factor [Clostridia bacterium]|nr:response regulator transcription factor [Clostridia bacterium]